MRVKLGVKLALIVIQVGIDVDEVKVFEPPLGVRFQLDEAAHGLGFGGGEEADGLAGIVDDEVFEVLVVTHGAIRVSGNGAEGVLDLAFVTLHGRLRGNGLSAKPGPREHPVPARHRCRCSRAR